MVEQAFREAADKLRIRLLKSDNVELGSVIPLPDGRKGAVVEEVESIGNKRIQARNNTKK